MVLRTLLAWQVLALMASGVSIFSTLLVNAGVRTPCLQLLLNYICLAILHGSRLVSAGTLSTVWQQQSRERSLFYLCLGIIDVEANYLLVRAFQLTSTLSVQLLDCFAIPCVFALSYAVFGRRVSTSNLVGATVALAGMGTLVYVDVSGEKANGEPNASLGDVMVLFGATLYAISNVAEEWRAKKMTEHNVVDELLLYLGTVGSVVSAVQMLALKETAVLQTRTVFYLAGSTLCLIMLYSFVPRLLRVSTAATMNLSFLTSDFWTLLASTVLFQHRFNLLYLASFATILIGLMLFHWSDITAKDTDKEGAATEEEPLMGQS